MAELEQLTVHRNPLVARLLSMSAAAVREGNKTRANDLLRQAAELEPLDETVWWSLLSVVETEDDRTVCLENILAINPNNLEAMRLLRLAHMEINLADLTPPIPAKSLSDLPPHAQIRPLSRRTGMRRRKLLLWAGVFVILAVAIGVIVSILIYGF